MSLRVFAYYCMVAGAWSGLIGWILGKIVPGPSPGGYWPTVIGDSIAGMCLGVAIAIGLSFLDAAFNLTMSRPGRVVLRVSTALLVGLFAGLIGGFVGGSLYFFTDYRVVFVLGWTLVGFLIGASICFCELLEGLFSGSFGGAMKKFIKCVIGGAMGGVVGGLIAHGLSAVATMLFGERNLWSPTAIGFVALGACIGLLVGLAQILLKEAWIKVEAGYRPGREMILVKQKTTVGRAEGSDLAFFGDQAVEKNHAQIVLDNGRYFLEDLQTPGGTYVNDVKVEGRAPLKAGDLIRLGVKSAFRFNERAKR